MLEKIPKDRQEFLNKLLHFKNNNGDFIIKCLVCDKSFDGYLMKKWHCISKSCPSCKAHHKEYEIDYKQTRYYEKITKDKKGKFNFVNSKMVMKQDDDFIEE